MGVCKNERRIYVFAESDGAYIRFFRNAQVASEAVGVTVGTIRRWCREQKPHGGYVYKWADQCNFGG